MFKNLSLLSLIFLVQSAVANGSGELTVQDFQSMDIFVHVQVLSSDRVFSDELKGEDVYKVNYFTDNLCTPNDQTDEVVCEPAMVCEYIVVDTQESQNNIFSATETGVSCDQDLEEVIGDPVLIDEY